MAKQKFNVVIKSSNGKVIKGGYVDFTVEPDEEIVEGFFKFEPNPKIQKWKYDKQNKKYEPDNSV